MPSRIVSASIMLSCAFFGGVLGEQLGDGPVGILVFLSGGLLVGLVSLLLMRIWLNTDVERLAGGTAGAFIGVLLSILLTWRFSDAAVGSYQLSATLHLMTAVLFGLVGTQIGAARAKDFRTRDTQEKTYAAILDTSVIIDGRIADVCETGFLTGDLIIPQFVLQELQNIADSSEATRRNRGRRGLDILNKMKKQAYLNVIIDDTDFPSVKEVDQKLVLLAKSTGFPLITNDFNLNKVAEVQSVKVLNMNQLATALKPTVLPGETMHVQVIREGKEPGQGVAYLDDGTMVVIDNGRRHMGRTVDVTVTSVLQTTAGRMIFAAVKGDARS